MGKGQVVYISHGAGPLPLLGDEGHRAMVDFMHGLPSRLRRPEAIVVFSAHWEEPVVSVISSPEPPLLYDYYGFPPQAYSIAYPAVGEPRLANRIVRLLGEAHIDSRLEPDRGFDHGVFVPLKLSYPAHDIPVVQVSLLSGLDAEAHLAIGRALAPLLDQDILVIGSGFSFHNMGAFSWEGETVPDPADDAFQDYLVSACTGPDPEEKLLDWQQAPFARYCHPREEHLVPLLVCQGVAGAPGSVIFDDRIMGKRAVAFIWH